MTQRIKSREQTPWKTLKTLSAFTYVERIETVHKRIPETTGLRELTYLNLKKPVFAQKWFKPTCTMFGKKEISLEA